MPGCFLGIDNGGTVAKAAIFTADGRELAVASRKVSLLAPKPSWAELDMAQLWQSTAAAIREAIDKAHIRPDEIACIACTGFGNGLLLVDQDGRPVRNAIASSDGRARAYVEQWLAAGVDKAIRPKTMQSIWPAQPNALLAWMRDHEPASIERSAAAIACKDFIRLCLTGNIFAELTDMSGTSLMNVASREYDPAVLEAFGISDMRRLLPPIRRCTEICGRVTAEAARQTGLAEGTPVAAGMFDIDACGLASGMIDPSQLSMVAGTWGCNLYISKTPVVDPSVFMTTCYAIDGYYLMLEGSATSASNLEWFVTEFFQLEREAAERQGQSVYDVCNELVEQTSPRESGIIFLPFLYGCNVSLDGKGCFIGLDGWQKRGHVLRAIYEGVVFSHLWHVKRLLKFRPTPQTIRLTGGAARSAAWAQIFADAFGVPVEIPAGTELGALGAAICAAVAAGAYPNFESACAAMARCQRVHQPNARLRDLYQLKYDRYEKALAAMAPAWADLAWKQDEGQSS